MRGLAPSHPPPHVVFLLFAHNLPHLLLHSYRIKMAHHCLLIVFFNCGLPSSSLSCLPPGSIPPHLLDRDWHRRYSTITYVITSSSPKMMTSISSSIINVIVSPSPRHHCHPCSSRPLCPSLPPLPPPPYCDGVWRVHLVEGRCLQVIGGASSC